MGSCGPASSRFFAQFSRWADCTLPQMNCICHKTPISLFRAGSHLRRGFGTTAQGRREPTTAIDERSVSVTESAKSQERHDAPRQRHKHSWGRHSRTHPTIREDKLLFSEKMRLLMRCIPHPVSLIIAALRDSESGTTSPQGMAVSSLSTVTIAPVPTISFNVRTPSRTWDAINSNDGCFRVHIMKQRREAARLAHLFSKGDAPAVFEKLAHKFQYLSAVDEGPFELIPALAGDHVAAILDCQVVKEMTVGDHVVVAAEVRDIHWNEEHEETIIYSHGLFRVTGAALFDPRAITEEK